jgi:hippurate hydrolase
LGTQSRERILNFTKDETALPSLHSPFFYPDPEQTLETGAKTLIAAALELMPPK